MQPAGSSGGQGTTLIQVAKTPTTSAATLITATPQQHNGNSGGGGSHLLLGKITTASGVEGADSSNGTSSTTATATTTLIPTQYIETDQAVYATTVTSAAAAANNNNGSNQVGFLGNTQLRRLYSSMPQHLPQTQPQQQTRMFAYEQYQEYAPIIYTPVCGTQTYYQTVGGQVLTSSAFGGASGTACGAGAGGGGAGTAQIVTHQGTTYILQSAAATAAAASSLEEDAAALSHTAKASPITVQWLVDNYETAEGVSLPRSTLYFHYLQHCQEHKLEPMNPASFGKLIRSVFLGLRTRRLGTRGNSKYHYYGIRIKPASALNHYVEDPAFALRHYPNYHRQSMEVVAEWKNLKSTTGGTTGSSVSMLSSTNSTGGSNGGGPLQTSGAFGDTAAASRSLVGSTGVGAQSTAGAAAAAAASGIGNTSRHQHAQFLGEATSALPNLNEICRSAGLPVPGSLVESDVETSGRLRNPSGGGGGVVGGLKRASSGSLDGVSTAPGLDGLPTKDLIKFAILYAQSAGSILEAVVNLDFSSIAGAWKAFWRTGDCSSEEESVYERTLSKERLYAVSRNAVVQQFMRLYDHTFYQSLAEVLIPNVLRPIPSSLTQAIRNFAKHLEVWMREALQDLDPVLLSLKLNAVSALAQTLRRYTSLNHLAQAARSVLKNPGQTNQMLIDLSRVDFNNVQEQASWVCQCSDATVAHLEQDFKCLLRQQASLEEWAQWLDTVVTGILRPLENSATAAAAAVAASASVSGGTTTPSTGPGANPGAAAAAAYTRAAHQLVLKWSFYSSMVIRDLTLRSAASFGSFHLIRLLYDEYIFYLVEHKVAAHLGMTPVAVMGEMGRAVTRPHCSLSRATAAALVAPSGGTESRRPQTSSSGKCKLEAVLTGQTEATQILDDAAICSAFATEAVFGAQAPPPPETVTGQSATGFLEPGVVPQVGDGEEMEELDDEGEEGDENDNENEMLCRAHESALLRAVQAAQVGEESAGKAADSDSTAVADTTVATALKLEEPTKQQESEASAPVASTADAAAASGREEMCDSPPPIVTHTTPIRKVVRVTTFEEDGVTPSSSTQSMDTITTTTTTTASTTAAAAVSLIIPSEAKRSRLT